MHDEAGSIQISARAEYQAAHSSPDEGRYVFAYRIEIANLGDRAVRLVGRYWRITDGNGQLQEVRGEGVVGQQPVIEPGGVFSYASGCVLATPVGSMEGRYQMVDGGGEGFDAPIAPFLLAVPGALH